VLSISSAAIRSSSCLMRPTSTTMLQRQKVDLVLVDLAPAKAGQHLDATDDHQWIHVAS
jgi:hypothetical protein